MQSKVASRGRLGLAPAHPSSHPVSHMGEGVLAHDPLPPYHNPRVPKCMTRIGCFTVVGTAPFT